MYRVVYMGYTIDDLAYVLGKLSSYGVRFVVIGDTVVQLALRQKKLSGDVDLFVYEPSPLVEEDFYRGIAEREGWIISSTEIGTPKLVARVNDREIVVELYENFMDIEIPEEILGEARTINLRGVKVRVLKPEHYFVLKARQGVDLDKLENYYKKLGTLDKKLLSKILEKFPEEERSLIIERLALIGITL
jgi:predicted nucleotidyltransferase